jgi:amidase
MTELKTSDSPDPLQLIPAWQASELLKKENISSVELLESCRKAFEAWNPSINALVLQNFERAREDSARCDEERRRGTALGRLHGIPFTIKESFDVQGWATTCGNPRLADNIAGQDARVVQLLRAEGAVVVGKTNVPLYLRDWQSYNELYGTTRNPRDTSRTPGGSSGGSAAAVCSGMSFFDIGSDIGSSLRNPAHYCGIFSHKSSHGLVSLVGHGIDGVCAAPDINVAGPLARSAFDLEWIFRAIAGDGIASPAFRLALPESRARELSEFRVGVLLQSPIAEVDDEVAAALESLGRHLEREGVQVSWNVRPEIDLAALWRTYVLMLRAATSAYLDDDSFDRMVALASVRHDIDDSYASLQFKGAALRHRDWLLLEKERLRFAAAWDAFFRDFDVLLCPAAATCAFPINQEGEPWQRMLSVNGKPQPMTTQLFWAGHSGLCGLPSTVAPAGFGKSGLPVGVQIVANRYHDLTSLRFAQCLERIGYRFIPPQAAQISGSRGRP